CLFDRPFHSSLAQFP
ncbi:TetW-regulatory peptide, partial [Dysosmobacter welbionis]